MLYYLSPNHPTDEDLSAGTPVARRMEYPARTGDRLFGFVLSHPRDKKTSRGWGTVGIAALKLPTATAGPSPPLKYASLRMTGLLLI